MSLSEVDEFVAKKLKPDEKLLYLGEKTISPAGLFRLSHDPRLRERQADRDRAQRLGNQAAGAARFRAHRRIPDRSGPAADENGNRDGTDLFYQEKVTHETRMGFLYQKLHRPRSYDYLKKSEKYKTWDDRLRMPQFAWANDPAAVEEVMTFVLGLTNERIPARYLPKTHTTPAQTAVALGAKDLNRFNCAGCHVLEMPKYTIPAGRQGRGGIHRFQGQSPLFVYGTRPPITSPSSIPRSRMIPRRSSMPT